MKKTELDAAKNREKEGGIPHLAIGERRRRKSTIKFDKEIVQLLSDIYKILRNPEQLKILKEKIVELNN